MKLDKNLVQNCILSIGFSIIVFIFSVYLLTSLGFIINLKVNIFYPIISILFSYVSIFYCIKEENKKTHIIATLICILIETLLIVLSSYYSSRFMDWTYDGKLYHQDAIIYLMSGWNPIYQTADEFVKNIPIPNFTASIWNNVYPKMTEIFSANILTITKDIEASKSYQILPFLASGLYSFYVFNKKPFEKINIFLKILFSIGIIFSPIFCSQNTTYMTDAIFYYFLLLSILAITDIETSEKNIKIPILILIMACVCNMGVKLGGLVVFITTFIIYLPYLFINNKDRFKKISKIFVLIFGIFLLCNINPYITNVVVQKQQVFYPLTGKNKVDFIYRHMPRTLENKNRFIQFSYGIFTREEIHGKEQNIKFITPFDVKKISKQLKTARGFGGLFPEIFIISMIALFFIRFRNKEEKKLSFLIYSIILLSIFINPFLYPSRYFPQIWSLTIFIFLFLANSEKQNTIKQWFSGVMIIFMILNCCILYENFKKREQKHRHKITKKINKIDTNNTIKLYIEREMSFIYKLQKNNINYEFVDKKYYEENKNSFEKIPYAIKERNDSWQIK